MENLESGLESVYLPFMGLVFWVHLYIIVFFFNWVKNGRLYLYEGFDYALNERAQNPNFTVINVM